MKKKAKSNPSRHGKSAGKKPAARAGATLAAPRGRNRYAATVALRPEFYKQIAIELKSARAQAYRAIDSLMVKAYWQVGRLIVEEEQRGRERAEYGASLLFNLSLRLTDELGPGFTERNLRNFRQFYLCFPIRHALRAESSRRDASGGSGAKHPASRAAHSPIRHALRAELSWTHYRLLIRVEDEAARLWYMNEAVEQNWSSRALARQISSLYYQRLLSSRDKRPVIQEMLEKSAALAPSPRDFIRDPVVLEFLDLPVDSPSLRESRLEQAIIGRLQHFLLELGKGFAFVARQQRVSTETKDFFVDLVFYNYILKCFVLIDLKVGELTHADIGQMDMYVRLYEDQHKGKGDNPTVGLILCTEKDQTVVKYSVLKDSRQLFASQYKLYLPSEKQLRLELEREREHLLREHHSYFGGDTTSKEDWE